MVGTNNTVVMSFAIAMFLLLIILLIMTYNSKCQMENVERFYSSTDNTTQHSELLSNNIRSKSSQERKVEPSDPLGNEIYKEIQDPETNNIQPTQTAGTCINKDRLTSADLLPMDANSKWAELNPQCSGDVQDQNYLTAGYHVGVNTVGQSLRNANRQLRYEPPNPQIPVSPWQISTIEPDQRGHGLLDIGAPPTY